MRVPRFHVAELPADGGLVELGSERARHARVLRLKPLDVVRLFDGQGTEARAEIREVAPDRILCEAQPSVRRDLRSPEVHLILGGPKKSALANIVRMATELGVQSIHLARCARSQPHGVAERGESHASRLRRIAQEAVRQSVGSSVPAIEAPAALDTVVARVPETAHRVVFWEEQPRTPFELGGRARDGQGPPSAWLLIGPEGGLEATEVEGLLAQGWSLAGLGPQILRVDTAACSAVALALDRLRALGSDDG